MKITKLSIILTTALLGAFCSGTQDSPTAIPIKNVTLKESNIHIVSQKQITGYLAGKDYERAEMYVKQVVPIRGNYLVKIIDMRTGEEKKDIGLPAGDVQSPNEFSSPGYIQFIHGNYVVFDMHQKIVFFDEHFNYLFAGMIPRVRRFVDFFQHNEETHFVLGYAQYIPKRKEYLIRVELYNAKKDKRPQLLKTLGELHNPGVYHLNGKKYYHVGYFFPTSWGFEKDGCIFYANTGEKNFFRHVMNTDKKECFELTYLIPKKYSDNDASKLGNYKDPQWPKHLKRKVVYISYPEDVYYFGLYDVGKDKIGIVGDIRLDNLSFRLDILNSRNGNYIESIWLPFGESFINSISTEANGFYQSCIDVDRGIYIWMDVDGEDWEDKVNVTRFRMD